MWRSFSVVLVGLATLVAGTRAHSLPKQPLQVHTEYGQVEGVGAGELAIYTVARRSRAATPSG